MHRRSHPSATHHTTTTTHLLHLAAVHVLPVDAELQRLVLRRVRPILRRDLLRRHPRGVGRAHVHGVARHRRHGAVVLDPVLFTPRCCRPLLRVEFISRRHLRQLRLDRRRRALHRAQVARRHLLASDVRHWRCLEAILQYPCTTHGWNALRRDSASPAIRWSLQSVLSNLTNQMGSLWKPLHMQTYFKKYEKFKITKALNYFNRTISIPSSSNIKKADLEKVTFLMNRFTN